MPESSSRREAPPSARLRVAHIVSPAAFGGLERVVAALADGLASRGHESHVISVFDAGGKVNPLPLDPASGASQHILEIPKRRYDRERSMVRRLCRDLEIEVVHTHGYRPDVIDGPGAAATERFVSTVHGFTGGGFKNRFFEWLQLRAYRRFDAVIAVSRTLNTQLAAAGVRPSQLQMIPNAWPGAGRSLTREEARRLLGIEGQGPVIGWVGRLSPEKGPDVLLDSLALLGDQPWRAAILGTGGAESSLRQSSRRAGIEDRVTWCGRVKDAAAYFRAFDVFVLSSRTEGTPIALLEAMAAEVPVVATAVGGVPDVVNEASAILVPSENPAALAAAILRTLRSPAEAAGRAAAAADRLSTTFGQDAWLARHEDLYARLLDR
jgi:glycosyltransferase involved in cell wall biosynthesis